jgi:hypothetical protein
MKAIDGVCRVLAAFHGDSFLTAYDCGDVFEAWHLVRSTHAPLLPISFALLAILHSQLVDVFMHSIDQSINQLSKQSMMQQRVVCVFIIFFFVLGVVVIGIGVRCA